MADRSLIVVGGGVVGLACAITAQRRGHRVILVDRDDPGAGCSFGNAGIVAVSEIFPLITPARLAALPRMVLSKDGPAVIRPGSLPTTLPWFLRAAGTLTKRRQAAILSALVKLNGRALSAWRDLLDGCCERPRLREKGMIRLIRDDRDWAELRSLSGELAAHGLASSLIDREELRLLEPALGGVAIGGLLHESDADIGDPFDLCNALLARFQAAGGTVLREEAMALRPLGDGAELTTDKGAHVADQIIVTLGLASGHLLRPLGCRVPLQAERGYHLAIEGAGAPLGRPVTFQRESCVATPMGTTLRVAGTVEFADADAPANWSRSDRLAGYAARYFDGGLAMGATRRWMGSRPSLPDSLPAIGRLDAAPTIGYAFGHQHLGVTQAAISARLVCDLMDGRATEIDHRPYDVGRF